MEIERMQIRKYVNGKYFVSADTKHTNNMLSNKLMTKEEIIKFLNQ